MTLIEADSVSKRFSGVQALADCSVQVAAGEIVGLVGPNGSGKTTLISVLMGLQRPDRGAVRFRGVDVTGYPPSGAKRRAIAAAYQTPQLVDSLTPRENLEFGARLKKWPGGRAGLPERIDTTLRELNLGRVADHPVYSLSGGQRKLVEFGRALVVQPELLFLDEPTAGVNASLEQLIADRIVTAAAAGAGVLVVSHNLPWTFSLCQRVVVLASGQVIADGTAEEVERDARVITAYLR